MRACLVISSTAFPGWANIYLSPTTLGSITMVITFGFAGGFTGGYFASRGDPFWTVSGGLAGVIGVSAGADVYAPTLAYLLPIATAAMAVYVGTLSRRRCASTTWSAPWRCTASPGFLGMLWVGIFAAGYPTGLNNVDSSIGGQLIGMATFLPLGFLTGWVASFVLKKLNLLRVPPEVELEGLDVSEYDQDLYMPEVATTGEMIVEPDGALTAAETVLRNAERRGGGLDAGLINSAPDCVTSAAGAENAARRQRRLHPAGQLPGLRRVHDVWPGLHLRRGRLGAETLYMILTWAGIIVTLVALAAWVCTRTASWSGMSRGLRTARPSGRGPPPQPGGAGDAR